MLKLIFVIIWFIIGLGYLVAVIREHGKKKDFKLIMLIIAGLLFPRKWCLLVT
jgi:hypothetical protein